MGDEHSSPCDEHHRHATNIVALHSRSHRGCDQLRFRPTDDVVISQLTRTLATFVAEEVAAIRVTVRHFAGRCNLEPAFHSLMSLLFWHF